MIDDLSFRKMIMHTVYRMSWRGPELETTARAR